MKQVKILKRPAQSPPPTNPAERVSAELASMLETCLHRERARLEDIYQARHDALLSALTTVLNQSLERLVSAAVQRETENLLTACQNIRVSKEPFAHLAPGAPDAPQNGDTRVAFATAFENALLPRFEDAVAAMLRSVAASVDAAVDERVVTPASSVLTSLGAAADAVRAAKVDVAQLPDLSPVAAAVAAAANGPAAATAAADAQTNAAVKAALDAGQPANALCIAALAPPTVSDAVITSTVDKVLNGPAPSEEALSTAASSAMDLILMAALVARNLSDRPEVRIPWLMEIITHIDDLEPWDAADNTQAEAVKHAINEATDRLTEFQRGDHGTPPQRKDAKLLVRVLKAYDPTKAA